MTEQPSKEDLKGLGADVLALTVLIQQSNNAEISHIYKEVVGGMQKSLDEAQAETAAIRNAITLLCDQPWAPNAQDILDALYPHTRDDVLARNAQYFRRGYQ